LRHAKPQEKPKKRKKEEEEVKSLHFTGKTNNFWSRVAAGHRMDFGPKSSHMAILEMM
jgi:hypothetical protein